MSQAAVTISAGNVHRALAREIELIQHRFPDVDPAEIAVRMEREFDVLEAGATIHAHLVTLAGAALTSQLIAEGHQAQPR